MFSYLHGEFNDKSGARYITNLDLICIVTKITIPLRSGNEQFARWTNEPKLHQTHN